MVRREVLGASKPIPVITPISKFIIFLAEIPSNLKGVAKEKSSKKNKIDNEIFYKSYYHDEVELMKNILSSTNFNKVREKLLKEYILPASILTINKKSNHNNKNHLKSIKYISKFYGINQNGFFKDNNGEHLIIYFQGHRGYPSNFKYYNEIKKMTEKLEFDLLTFSSFGLGFNSFDSLSFPIKLPQHEKQYNFSSEKVLKIIKF